MGLEGKRCLWLGHPVRVTSKPYDLHTLQMVRIMPLIPYPSNFYGSKDYAPKNLLKCH